MSASASTLRPERQGDLAFILLDRPPVNGLNRTLLAELRDALHAARDDAGVRGVLLASAHPRAFSAGLDLQEIAGYDAKERRAFGELLLRLLEEMAGYPKPLVVEIPGHAIAGGLLLASTADVRVAARGSYRLVMSEIDLGIPVPRPDVDLLTRLVGQREAHRLLLEGHVYDAEEALAVGLVDELAEPGGLREAATARLRLLAEKDPDAFASIKASLRAPLVEAMAMHREEALQEALGALGVQ